jgi:hypothetical protein
MNHIFTFYFKGSDMRRIITANTGYVLVKSEIIVKEIDRHKYGVIKVTATSYRKDVGGGGEIIIEDTALGCPVPPCVQQNGLIGEDCMDEVEELFQSYVKNLID